MVMMCQPVYDAVMAVEKLDDIKATRVLLTPQGELLKQETVERLATAGRLLLIAGHYEGIDERVVEELDPLEISVGDYVLSGGELPAMILIDAVVRLLPGALGHEDSAAEDSFTERRFMFGKGKSATEFRGRALDCPHYTRPREWHGRAVPEVLLSGDHESIARWQMEQAIKRTRERRPDLLDD
jgi:tRNA (guanine37-N1)-methyltransferase